MSPGVRISPSCQNAAMCFSPSPSMSKQSRDTKCLQPLDRLSGADQPAGAAPRRHAVLAHREAAADRAVVGKCVWHGVLGGGRARPRRSAGSRRRRAARSTVSPMRTSLRCDLVLVVQRRALHDDPADGDRLEHRDRGQRALAADRDRDVAQHRLRLLRREFLGDRPARRPADACRAAPATRGR